MTNRITELLGGKVKPKFVVAICPSMNNFDCLGTYLETDEYQILIHGSPVINYIDGEVVPNFDFAILNSRQDDIVSSMRRIDVLPPHRAFDHKRYGKLVQQIKLSEWIKKNGSDKTLFKKVPIWDVGLTSAIRNVPTVPAGTTLVIKPDGGARGLGHFVIDPEKVNLDLVCQSIIALKTDDDGDSLAGMLKHFDGGVTYHTGTENYPLEGLVALKEQGLIVQAKVPDVVAEYRIITDHEGEPSYCQERVIKNPGSALPQATGGGALINLDAILAPHEAFSKHIGDSRADKRAQSEFYKLCAAVIGPLSSIDLFFTKDGHWGIFEYCNQFGITGLPAETTFKMHADFIDRLLIDHLSNRPLNG